MTRMQDVMPDGVMLSPDEERSLAKDIVEFVVGMARALPLKDGKFATHGDLHGGNVLIAPVTKRLSAIIDFGTIALYREKNKYWPSVDLSSQSFNKRLHEEYDLRKAEMPDTPNALPSAGLQP